MADESHLDSKYFIDTDRYNCPYCNRRHVSYHIENHVQFDWDDDQISVAFFAKCASCEKTSIHLTFKPNLVWHHEYHGLSLNSVQFPEIDDYVFYSQPRSYFVLDTTIPKTIRKLVSEADACLKMNFTTGASACMRKAIYELLARKNSHLTSRRPTRTGSKVLRKSIL